MAGGGGGRLGPLLQLPACSLLNNLRLIADLLDAADGRHPMPSCSSAQHMKRVGQRSSSFALPILSSDLKGAGGSHG